mmetsp:Transcript_12680/g.18992  ORF Transcript_12680/g.18992 Transcript_12680/m.18992 type:complete len:622 (+) Transcript_12680:109-1974(+)
MTSEKAALKAMGVRMEDWLDVDVDGILGETMEDLSFSRPIPESETVALEQWLNQESSNPSVDPYPNVKSESETKMQKNEGLDEVEISKQIRPQEEVIPPSPPISYKDTSKPVETLKFRGPSGTSGTGDESGKLDPSCQSSKKEDEKSRESLGKDKRSDSTKKSKRRSWFCRSDFSRRSKFLLTILALVFMVLLKVSKSISTSRALSSKHQNRIESSTIFRNLSRIVGEGSTFDVEESNEENEHYVENYLNNNVNHEQKVEQKKNNEDIESDSSPHEDMESKHMEKVIGEHVEGKLDEKEGEKVDIPELSEEDVKFQLEKAKSSTLGSSSVEESATKGNNEGAKKPKARSNSVEGTPSKQENLPIEKGLAKTPYDEKKKHIPQENKDSSAKSKSPSESKRLRSNSGDAVQQSKQSSSLVVNSSVSTEALLDGRKELAKLSETSKKSPNPSQVESFKDSHRDNSSTSPEGSLPVDTLIKNVSKELVADISRSNLSLKLNSSETNTASSRIDLSIAVASNKSTPELLPKKSSSEVNSKQPVATSKLNVSTKNNNNTQNDSLRDKLKNPSKKLPRRNFTNQVANEDLKESMIDKENLSEIERLKRALQKEKEAHAVTKLKLAQTS